MVRVLFVCHGNICRSPMAEFVMKKLVKEQGRDEAFFIASAATSTEEIGNPVYPPVKRILESLNLDCRKKRAVRITAADYARYDHIVCMDRNNLRNLRRIIPDDPQRKVSLLMDHTPHPHDVADPWYTGDFETTLKDVTEGCAALLAKL